MFPHWPDPDLRETDPDEYARQYRAAFMDRPAPEPDPADLLTDSEFVRLVDGWTRQGPPASQHLHLSIAAGHFRGRPLDAAEPVPGCGCERCTGRPARPVRARRPHRDLSPAIDVDRARSVGVLEVARRLGLGEPRRAGRELVVRCPLHDDSRPSLRLDPTRNVWFCDPCGEGGDAIRLLMRARGLSFLGACRELAA